MALRRLLSGWLIAMAALARSVALALERASEDRSTPSDPVMAALAERYPGAPAHWLAHVAERTSQLAEAGEAPLSLNSDPTAWPPARPDGLAPLSAPAAEPEPAPRDPRGPAPRRDIAAPTLAAPTLAAPTLAAPTLAALRERSSEVWRRPDTERPRRSRPVFATVQPGSTPERERSATLEETGAPPRRPRSPLTFVGSPIQAAANASEPSRPGSDTPTAKASQRQATWPTAPPPHMATPDTTKGWHDLRRSADRPAIDHAFTQKTRPTEGLPEALSDQIGATPAVRRQRFWFFAKSALGRLGRSLELSTDPERRPGGDRMDAEGAIASDLAPAPRAAISFSTSDHQTAAPERAWRVLPPPASRRSIFRALAALRAKPRPRTDRLQASESTVARAAAIVDRPSPRSGREHPAQTFTPSRARPSTRTTPAFSPIGRDAPPSRGESHEPRRVVHRVVQQASNMPISTGETGAQDKRPTFAALPRTVSSPVSRGFAVSPPDVRWPALPPTTLASPHGIEAPPPRWDVLAREQEEGRWSV